jgi:autoinducer 2 (AI-2) kinase
VSYLLAIDLGTGSCRALLLDETGSQAAIAQREWSHPPVPGVPGSQVFDTAANWRLICECITEAIGRAGIAASDIGAVSSSSMREGMVLYDRDGKELWACPNVDSRASVEAGELVESGLARRIYDRAGDWVAITAPPRLMWIRRHEPEVFARTAHLTMLSDWVIVRLTGRFLTDPSCGSSSNMFDLATRTWSRLIVEWCGLTEAVLPEVVEPGTRVGEVTEAAATETGLAPGTPVIMGGADTQLGLVGIGVTKPGSVTIVGGSFWQTTVITDRPLIDPEARLRTLCHAVPGQWMTEGIGFYHGIVMRWFRDAFCELEKERAIQRGVDPYVVMEEAAATIPPGSNGVLGIFSNVMDAKRWVHASPSFLGFDVDDPSRTGRAACIRAIEEEAAYTSLGHLRIIESLTGSQWDEVVFTGGASKGHLWPQVVSDVLGVRVRVPVVKESTALAAAMYAGLGIGTWSSLDEVVDHLVRFERTFEPDAAAHDVYRDGFARWREVYLRQLELSEAGLLRPLWRAAGT